MNYPLSRRNGPAAPRANTAPRLRCEPLEDRVVPTVVVLDQLLGGTLDASLLADGVLTAAECAGTQTVSRGALTTASALKAISVTSPDGIAFNNLSVPLTFALSANFTTAAGGITFADPTDAVTAASGTLTFAAPAGDLFLGSLVAPNVSVTASGNVSVAGATATAGTLALTASGALTVGGPLSAVGGTVALTAPTLNLDLSGVTAPALSLGGTAALSLGALGSVSLANVGVINLTGGTAAVSVDLAARGFQNGSTSPDAITVSTTAGGVLNVVARDGGTGPAVTLFSGLASGVGSLTLNGSADAEAFVVDDTNAGVPALVVNGGGPTAAPGDTLSVVGAMATTTGGVAGAGTIAVVGRSGITFTGIENPATSVPTAPPTVPIPTPTDPTDPATPAVSTVSIVATDATASEVETGQTPNPGRLMLIRTGDTSNALTVGYTLGGTAVVGLDYLPLAGTVTFAAGSATAVIDVVALNDAVVDGDRTVSVTLTAGTGYTPAGGPAVVTIVDNDVTVPTQPTTPSPVSPPPTPTTPTTPTAPATPATPTPTASTPTPGPGTGSKHTGARPASDRIVTGSTDGSIAVFDRGASTPTFRIPAGFGGATAVAVGDVNGDGIADVVSVIADGGPMLVRVFDGATGAERLSFLALPAAVRTGATVAVGDLNGDGKAEIVVGTASIVPAVLVFDGQTGARLSAFLAGTGTGGVRVATGDVDGDGVEDIVTTHTNSPEVGVFDLSGGRRNRFLAFDPQLGRSGLTAGAADLDGDGRAEIIAGTTLGGVNWVMTFTGDGVMRTVAAFPLLPSLISAFGPPVAGSDVDGDGKEEVLVSVGPFVGVLDGTTLAVRGVMQPHAGAGGIYVG